MSYQKAGIPLVVLAGKDYGMGSSRDWAAKGAYLLGVRAVIAVSFERIHRSNLVGMGVLPLCFRDGETAESLGLDGLESFDIPVDDDVTPRQSMRVTARHPSGKVTTLRHRLPHRHAGRGRVLPQRRHPPHGAAEDGEGLSCGAKNGSRGRKALTRQRDRVKPRR